MKKSTHSTPNGTIDLYESPENNRFVLYLHGGGLVYGSKSDLPTDLKTRFLTKGYSVIALDYPLAPNHSLKEILEALEKTVSYLLDTIIKDRPFGICGRSAGSFLMLHLTKYLQKSHVSPHFLVNFYGYTDLQFIDDPRELIPQKIEAKQIEGIDLKSPIQDDPSLSRYLLYHYAVQQHLLPEYYGIETLAEFALTKEALEHFPRTFSTASTSDKEIPFRYSKSLARSIPNSRFVPLYYLDHDFLKDIEKPEVQRLLDTLEEWLEEQKKQV